MYLEDITVRPAETLAKLVLAYGHKASDEAAIWADPANAALAGRGGPATLAAGDVRRMPIPGTVRRKVVRVVARGVANGTEIAGHLHLLASGIGTSGVSFARQGWTFRAPPP